MVLRICALLLLLALAAVAPAVPAETMSDREVVGHSDVIIVGTVKTAEPTINGMGQAWIAVQRVIKGKPTTDVTVEYPLPTKDNAAGWGIALKPGDIDVFCLQRDAVGCYALTFSRSVMPAAMSDTIDQAVKDFPIEAVLIAPPGPIVFNQPVAMTLRVTNNGENPLVVTALEIAAFMTAPVGTNAVLTREIPVDVPRAKGGNLRDRTPAVLLQIPEGETRRNDDQRHLHGAAELRHARRPGAGALPRQGVSG